MNLSDHMATKKEGDLTFWGYAPEDLITFMDFPWFLYGVEAQLQPKIMAQFILDYMGTEERTEKDRLYARKYLSQMKPISTADAARYLGVTENNVRDLLRRGRIPEAYKIGTTWVIPAQALVDVAYRKRGPSRGKDDEHR